MWIRTEAINTKAGMLLAFQGAVILILLNNPSDFFRILGQASWLPKSSALISIVLFSISFICSMRTLETLFFPYPTSNQVQKARKRLMDKEKDNEKKDDEFCYLRDWKTVSRDDFLEKMLDGYDEVINISESNLEEKSRRYRWAFYFTAIFSLSLLATTLLTYWAPS